MNETTDDEASSNYPRTPMEESLQRAADEEHAVRSHVEQLALDSAEWLLEEAGAVYAAADVPFTFDDLLPHIKKAYDKAWLEVMAMREARRKQHNVPTQTFRPEAKR